MFGAPRSVPLKDENAMNRMFRSLGLAIAGILLITGTAFAANPHQVGSTSVSISGNSLTISASIAGLGNVPTASFDLSGTIDVSSRCYTRSGNKPQAANKQETLDVAASGEFPVRNGRTNVSFTVSPISTLTCPPGQRVVIESATYDLTISGEGVTIHASGSF
jgi:hypothetical protein